ARGGVADEAADGQLIGAAVEGRVGGQRHGVVRTEAAGHVEGGRRVGAAGEGRIAGGDADAAVDADRDGAGTDAGDDLTEGERGRGADRQRVDDLDGRRSFDRVGGARREKAEREDDERGDNRELLHGGLISGPRSRAGG